MSSSSDQTYEPLPNATSIRILILAPGEPDDSNISFSMLTSDLDFDHATFPDSTPRPIPNLAYVTEGDTGEDASRYPIRFDMDSRSTPQEPRLHPFQRYEALSYVWGDVKDPQYVFLDGEKPVPVTESLYSALRSLRLRHGARKLWVDALCINQSDHEEKKVQLALMKRVYQQAEKVVAYLPLSTQDERNINELVPRIMRAIAAHQKHQDARAETGPGLEQYTGPFNSISDLETRKVARNENESMTVTLSNAMNNSEEKQLYLEGFGLPRGDSLLWDSWRRLFGAPYFRRMWIWQEVTLGNNLHFCFGDGEANAEPLFLAHHFLAENSAAMNMSYTAAWCVEGDDGQDTLNDRIIGSGNATTMLRERILRRYGRSGVAERRLIQKLAQAGTFEATDPRDKIYALLGLAVDGAEFTPHVSYAPWDSKEEVFLRFAKLFVERSQGIEVLLQAGIRDENDEWPSWVPHWDDLERPVPVDASRSTGPTTTRIQVDNNNNRALDIYGTILDDINVVNDSVFETLQVTDDGINSRRFLQNMTSAFIMVFKALSKEDPEAIFEQLFCVLAQPKSRRDMGQQQEPEQSDSAQGDTASTKTSDQKPTPSANDEVIAALNPEAEFLRTGFHEFLKYIWALKSQIDSLLAGREDNSEDNTTQVIQVESPAQYHAFQKAAMKNIHHRRLCVTKGERVGVAPKRVKVGDKVVVFEGCDIQYVLRPFENKPGVEGGEDEEVTYRLVGPALFYSSGDEMASLSKVVQSIRIV
ncbi:HET-domain-containing protein [Astrocystis sublimbata]|nr:HET-domain-containing protein [Astrocystis sublimbata]